MTLLNQPSGEILAENVDFETFVRDYAGQHVEWVNGAVIKMPAVTRTHDKIVTFLTVLFDYYLDKTDTGEVYGDPFAARLPPDGRVRQPDLLVVLKLNFEKLKDSIMNGAPDLVVEVGSPESSNRDRGDKFHEYELAGVSEYWIIDPVHNETLFYMLDEENTYKAQAVDQDGYYTSAVLPKLRFRPAILLNMFTPRASTAFQLVQEMLAE